MSPLSIFSSISQPQAFTSSTGSPFSSFLCSISRFDSSTEAMTLLKASLCRSIFSGIPLSGTPFVLFTVRLRSCSLSFSFSIVLQTLYKNIFSLLKKNTTTRTRFSKNIPLSVNSSIHGNHYVMHALMSYFVPISPIKYVKIQ